MRCRQGFTLAELFLALALLALLFSLAIVHFDRIRGVIGKVPAEDQIRQLLSQGHQHARSTGKPVYLNFAAEEAALRLNDESGNLLRELPLGDPESNDLQVHFFRTLPEQKLDGESIYEIEEQPVDYLLFHPSGVTPPVEIHLNSVRQQVVIPLDPFSSAPRSPQPAH